MIVVCKCVPPLVPPLYPFSPGGVRPGSIRGIPRLEAAPPPVDSTARSSMPWTPADVATLGGGRGERGHAPDSPPPLRHVQHKGPPRRCLIRHRPTRPAGGRRRTRRALSGTPPRPSPDPLPRRPRRAAFPDAVAGPPWVTVGFTPQVSGGMTSDGLGRAPPTSGEVRLHPPAAEASRPPA